MKKEFEFIRVFAEFRDLKQASAAEVYNEVCHWLREERKRTGWSDDKIIDDYMGTYFRDSIYMMRKYKKTRGLDR